MDWTTSACFSLFTTRISSSPRGVRGENGAYWNYLNNLHSDREARLTDQYYFVQRIRNVDERFANNPGYIYAAAAYIEKNQLQRNVNLSYRRGKKSTNKNGEQMY